MVKKIFALIVILVLIAGIGWRILQNPSKKSPTQTQPSTQQKQTTKQPSFNKKQYSIDDPTSIWVVVNKARPLNPLRYTPTDLTIPSVPLLIPGDETMKVRTPVADALVTMFASAKKDNINLMIASGYRSYNYQVSLYNSYIRQNGQTETDKSSARAGHSEHQTGLAADLEPTSKKCQVDPCFANLPEGKWLATNAYKYGFVIRYPDGKTAVTGYEYEPWHVRYVGIPLATAMHNQHIETLEEFFGLPAAPDYK